MRYGLLLGWLKCKNLSSVAFTNVIPPLTLSPLLFLNFEKKSPTRGIVLSPLRFWKNCHKGGGITLVNATDTSISRSIDPSFCKRKWKKLEGGGQLTYYLGHMERGNFFDLPKKINPSVQKIPLYGIYGNI